MFLFYTRVHVLFLPCKKPGPLIVKRNTKIEEQSILEERSFSNIEQSAKPKISEKVRQRPQEEFKKA